MDCCPKCKDKEYFRIFRHGLLKIRQPKSGAYEFYPAPEYFMICDKCFLYKRNIDGSVFEWLRYKILRLFGFYKYTKQIRKR